MSSAPSNDMLQADRIAAGPDLASFFSVSLDLLCIRDREFRFVRVNQAWEATLGYRVEELEGQKMAAFIHPDDMPASLGHMQRLEIEDEVVGFINRYRHRDGTYRRLEWRARRGGDHVYGVARDVTERLELEAQMATAREEAEAANRAKSDFLANMSHEIRTPLNGVIGVAAALAQTELTPAQRDMLDLIANSGATLERLVSDILDFSKIEAGRLEIETRPFDLRAELDGLLEMFRLRAADKGLAFPATFGESARGEFLGDSVRLKQVLGNLLSNAVKFTHQGQVAVVIDLHEPQANQPGRLVLEVADTGVGFEPEFAANLFQRFRQADSSITRRFGGAGLGLSITRALVEILGGEITAASRPGAGSLFRVELPLPRARPLADYDLAQASAARRRPAAPRTEHLAALRILLAEDHPINQRVVELILAPFGVELTIVEDGRQALAAHAADRFDLILMDMQMPVMDGLAATRAIRAREAPGGVRTPVVMLSANAMTQHRDEAAAAGADLHLAKPVTAASLIEALGLALA
ncbi:MAG: ATP-binding protein [Pseudomonadota bacterium]|uniref:ATP-binding protein n=1 Tax=Phenylobacterium sp. TaxID=1871053 RepID=UPI002600072F|nr:ATP-binding protein [Phenylobacterium sp.]